MKVTLSKALMLKNRLAGQISVLETRVGQNLSYPTNTTPSYEARDVLEDLVATRGKLVVIKTAISQANRPKVDLIFELSELKSHLKFLGTLRPKSGPEIGRFLAEETVVWNASFSQVEIDQMVVEKQARIDAVQEELDHFNHTTQIEIPD